MAHSGFQNMMSARSSLSSLSLSSSSSSSPSSWKINKQQTKPPEDTNRTDDEKTTQLAGRGVAYLPTTPVFYTCCFFLLANGRKTLSYSQSACTRGMIKTGAQSNHNYYYCITGTTLFRNIRMFCILLFNPCLHYIWGQSGVQQGLRLGRACN